MGEELERLTKELLEADLTVDNPEMQAVIEHELARWVESYETKKQTGLHDCYGSPGEIPDTIPVNGEEYSPPEILEHVRKRDEVGMHVLRKIDEYQKQHSLWHERDAAQMVLGLGKKLDEVVIHCMCGQHNQTLRDVMLGIIHPNPDSMIVTAGLPDSIMQWYGAPEEYWKPSAFMHILNEGEPSEDSHRDLMRIVEVPESFEIIDVYFMGMYSTKTIYISRELIPEELQEHVKPDARFIVEGNLATKYKKDLKLTKVELAPEHTIQPYILEAAKPYQGRKGVAEVKGRFVHLAFDYIRRVVDLIKRKPTDGDWGTRMTEWRSFTFLCAAYTAVMEGEPKEQEYARKLWEENQSKHPDLSESHPELGMVPLADLLENSSKIQAEPMIRESLELLFQ